MKIERMGIDAYRNLEHLVLDFDDVNVIYGENAQGKTNLIEAVYLFTGAKIFAAPGTASWYSLAKNRHSCKFILSAVIDPRRPCYRSKNAAALP